MKNNAILRIIIWSVVIVALLGIMLGVMVGVISHNRFQIRSQSPLESMTPNTVGNSLPTKPVVAEPTAATTPATDKTTTVQETIPTTAPQPTQSLQTGTTTTDGMVSFPSSQVRELEIVWASGNIQIQSGDVTDIQISETKDASCEYEMYVTQKGTKVSVSFSQGHRIQGFGIGQDLTKDLTILVPKDWTCKDLEIDVASATVEVQGLTVQDLEFNGASGECRFLDCAVNGLDVNTASGDVQFTGTLNELDCESASANIYAELSNVPNKLEMESMSGQMDITLPQNAGFTVSLEGANSQLISDFETTMQNRRYVCGDGRCRISMETMSGSVILRKAA